MMETEATTRFNDVLEVFNDKFLPEVNSEGIAVMDRLPNQAGYPLLQSKFQQAGYDGARKFDRVVLFASTCDGASHVSSAVDIVLGAFRWVVNSKDKEEQRTNGEGMMRSVAKMMYSETRADDARMIRGRGLLIRPRVFQRKHFEEMSNELVEYLQGLL